MERRARRAGALNYTLGKPDARSSTPPDHLPELSDLPDALIGDKCLQQSCFSHTSLQTVHSSNYMITNSWYYLVTLNISTAKYIRSF
jgi:hypothetical protein